MKLKEFHPTILRFESISSTNTYLKENYKDLNNHTIVLADFQTDGKGQFEHTWISEPFQNLLCSILLKDDISSEVCNQVIVDTILNTLSHFGIKAWYKAPNDIFVNSNKIAGVLIETKYVDTYREYIIIGVGFNINQTTFPAFNATSLALELNSKVDVQKVFTIFIDSFKIELIKHI
ncbi:MAG: biotin--[acetyl-CoA-carboxylase] ligase [Firmicutes bacterium]|nr:biotin--[acetyl-CoA-carboxylase] ligase [Bacillota bacterium]